jgi:hypothetical protein
MRLGKDYKKFYSIGQNRYYLLKYEDELHLVTESFLKKKEFLFFKKEIKQGLKLLKLTAPISILFQKILECELESEDKEFPDMNRYTLVNNTELRKEIEQNYKDCIAQQELEMREDFKCWVDDFILTNTGKMKETEMNNVISVSRNRLEDQIRRFKEMSPLSAISFKWNNKDNLIVKKMLENNMEFLYSQKVGANYKIYYLYELDTFGTVTIYEVHCVKNVVKSISTFIYNRTIIEKMIICMVNNQL